jgi:type I site-specific restriction endonuclease
MLVICLTATLGETASMSSLYHFGTPTSTSALKQGIRDGFLAP